MKDAHPSVSFNSVVMEQSASQKYLGIYLEGKPDSNAHIKKKVNKAKTRIGLIRKLQSKLPRNVLVTIYKSFIRPHFADFVYDQPTNDSFFKKLGSVQCGTALVITGTMKLYKKNSINNWVFNH